MKMSHTTADNCITGSTLNWKCRDRILPLNSDRPLVMGILNATPDSFSDGGRFVSADKAVEHALSMIREGAEIIDVGGESTRPGAEPVSPSEELDRVIPVIERLAAENVIVSADTMKAKVAAAAVRAGARIINDVSACSFDPDMPRVAADSGAGIVLMHMKGEPRTMQSDPFYEDLILEVKACLSARAEAMICSGVSRESIMIDPGIGFGKTAEHNLKLLAAINRFSGTGFPVLIGISRKSFLGKITGRDVNERLAGSLAGLVWCLLKSVHVVRVHDVKETVDAIKIIRALKEAE